MGHDDCAYARKFRIPISIRATSILKCICQLYWHSYAHTHILCGWVTPFRDMPPFGSVVIASREVGVSDEWIYAAFETTTVMVFHNLYMLVR